MTSYSIPRDSDGSVTAFAWPGGYPMYYVTRDGLTICPQCAGDDEKNDSDPVVGGDVFWEGPPMWCDDCGREMESAYGDPDNDSEDES